MKKGTLLSFLTAIAIVVTTAGTYALWDSLTDDTTANVTFRNPVTITVASSYTLDESSDELGTLPTASGTVTFTVSNENNLADTLTIVPTVSGGNSAAVEDFAFVVTDSTESSSPKLAGDSSAGFVDKTLTTTTYNVQVTPKDSSVAKVAGQQVNIQLTATLSKAAN